MSQTHKVKRENVALVLCRPKYGGNVGAVARIALNMGFCRLVVTGAPDTWNMEEAKIAATHFAAPLLARIEYYPTLKEALVDFQWVVGTTSKLGKSRRPVFFPRETAGEIVSLSQENRVAILFGPEDKGLSNEDLAYCHRLTTIPTAGEMASLNLSHAAMVICYELFLAGGTAAAFAPPLARVEELRGMYGQIEELLREVDFIKGQSPERQMLYLRRFFSRVRLTSQEVQVIRGICRQVSWAAKVKIPS